MGHPDCLPLGEVLQNVPNGPGFERELSSRHASFAKSRSRTECDGRDRRTDGQTDGRRTNREIREVPHNRPFGQSSREIHLPVSPPFQELPGIINGDFGFLII